MTNVVAGTRTDSIGDLKPGEWQAAPELFIGCPNGKGLCWHPITPGVPNANGAIWAWDGDRELPTLSPSIFCAPAKGGCGFHGHLTRGVLR